jgi:hypothetical protein
MNFHQPFLHVTGFDPFYRFGNCFDIMQQYRANNSVEIGPGDDSHAAFS